MPNIALTKKAYDAVNLPSENDLSNYIKQNVYNGREAVRVENASNISDDEYRKISDQFALLLDHIATKTRVYSHHVDGIKDKIRCRSFGGQERVPLGLILTLKQDLEMLVYLKKPNSTNERYFLDLFDNMDHCIVGAVNTVSDAIAKELGRDSLCGILANYRYNIIDQIITDKYIRKITAIHFGKSENDVTDGDIITFNNLWGVHVRHYCTKIANERGYLNIPVGSADRELRDPYWTYLAYSILSLLINENKFITEFKSRYEDNIVNVVATEVVRLIKVYKYGDMIYDPQTSQNLQALCRFGIVRKEGNQFEDLKEFYEYDDCCMLQNIKEGFENPDSQEIKNFVIDFLAKQQIVHPTQEQLSRFKREVLDRRQLEQLDVFIENKVLKLLKDEKEKIKMDINLVFTDNRVSMLNNLITIVENKKNSLQNEITNLAVNQRTVDWAIGFTRDLIDPIIDAKNNHSIDQVWGARLISNLLWVLGNLTLFIPAIRILGYGKNIDNFLGHNVNISEIKAIRATEEQEQVNIYSILQGGI